MKVLAREGPWGIHFLAARSKAKREPLDACLGFRA